MPAASLFILLNESNWQNNTYTINLIIDQVDFPALQCCKFAPQC